MFFPVMKDVGLYFEVIFGLLPDKGRAFLKGSSVFNAILGA